MNETESVSDQSSNVGSELTPYAYEKIKDDMYVVSSYFGGWCFLSDSEIDSLKKGAIPSESHLRTKLEEAGILINNNNLDKVVDLYSNINRNLFLPLSLHMLSVTNTCNYRCTYCQAGVSQGKGMMSLDTALKTLKFIFKTGSKNLMIEFQGGECLLNWKVVKFVVENATELNKISKRNLKMCIVSNLGLMNEEKLEFLTRHGVTICTSLDGTEAVHDSNRVTAGGASTFKKTIEKIRFINGYYKKHNLDYKVDAISTITKRSLSDPKGLVDLYLELGLPTIHLRPVVNFGDALPVWDNLTYSPEEFFEFWKESMEYIFKLNKEGQNIMERGAFHIATKILAKQDPLYIELMNPSGTGRSTLLYNYDGKIYNSDEGRMIPETLFALGTVDQEPKEVLASEENVNVWASCYTELCDYNSPYKAWGGIHPVHTYQNQGTIIPNISKAYAFQVYKKQCRYIFEKIAERGFEKNVLLFWTRRGL